MSSIPTLFPSSPNITRKLKRLDDSPQRDMLNTAFKGFSERGRGKKGPKRLPGIGKNLAAGWAPKNSTQAQL